MPAIAQVSVNFANVQDVQNLTTGDSFQVTFRAVNPFTLARYCLVDGEYDDFNAPDGIYRLNSAQHLKYVGGFITSGDKINVKYGGDLTLRNRLLVNNNFIVGPVNQATKTTTYGGDTTPKFTIFSISGDFTTTGNGTIDQTLRVIGNTSIGSINAPTFVVTSSSGNTVVRGTSILKGNVYIDSAETAETTSKVYIESSTGNIDSKGTLKVRGDFTVTPLARDTISNRKFFVESSSGNTVSLGTLDYTGSAILRNTLGLYGNLTIGTNGVSNFAVTASSGNTSFIGNLTINTSKFIVTASTGNTQIFGDLGIGNNTSYNKFVVQSSTGNTSIEGTLTVTNTTSLGNILTMTGNSTTNRITGVNRKTTYSALIDSNVATDTLTIGDFLTYRAPASLGSTGTEVFGGIDSTSGRPTFKRIRGGANISVTETNGEIFISSTQPLGVYINNTANTLPIQSIISSIFPPANFAAGTRLNAYVQVNNATAVTGSFVTGVTRGNLSVSSQKGGTGRIGCNDAVQSVGFGGDPGSSSGNAVTSVGIGLESTTVYSFTLIGGSWV